MNIFVIEEDTVDIARSHCDKHVSKMILESAQMLCTAHWNLGEEAPYKPVHFKHPCTLWAGESLANWLWLKQLALDLNREFMYRYSKKVWHKSAEMIYSLKSPVKIQNIGLTKRPQCMPDEYKVEGDVIQAYRNYYIGDKSRFAVWTKREPPRWYKEGVCYLHQKAI